jgi:predicted nuclease of restriction endonuclease-like (RecB) superfamily
MNLPQLPSTDALLGDVRRLIDNARVMVAAAVNVAMTKLYWQIGHRIHTEILAGERAEYGEQIIATLAQKLVIEYGQGFSEKNLRHMISFAQSFPDEQIVSTLSRELSWSHLKEMIYLDKPLQREFYTEMCRIEHWSVRTLRKQINSMLYERTALSRKPEDLIRLELAALRDEGLMSPDLAFRDPYVLDFLNLKDTYSERDLETAIIREMEQFLLELGSGFTFVSRQKRMVIDHEDHTLDLLFYHRKLRRLVAVELKLGRFRAAYKGQMELYLRWLEKYEMEAGEKTPIGLILCAEGGHETIELLRLDQSGIRVAEYLTELPTKEVLAHKLHTAIQQTRARLAQRNTGSDQTEQE